MSHPTTTTPAPAHQAHGHAHDTHHAAGLHHAHVCPPSLFLKVLVALLILTIITVWVGQFNFGSLNMFVAMSIAAVKASLVLTFFMHLKYDTAVNNIFILSSFFFLGLLFLFLLGDLATRGEADRKLIERSPLDNVTPVWHAPKK